MIKQTVALLFCIFITNFATASEVQEQRFAKWMDILEKPLAGAESKEEAAKAILKSPEARIAAFNLQALGRVYGDLDEGFNKIRKSTKELEDALGMVDKYSTQKKQKELKEAKEKLADLLKENAWFDKKESPRISKMREFLSDFKWPKASDDLAYVTQQLKDQLKSVDNKEFEFTYLESDNGLHELRRELRWFLIESRVLNGMFQFKDAGEKCPLEAYTDIVNQPIAKSKYSQLPENDNEPRVCQVSKCLFIGVVEAVEDLGQLKDEAEERDIRDDKVPRDLRERADTIYERFKSNELLPALIEEVKACE